MSSIDGNDQAYFLSGRTDKTYYSKTFGRGEVLRYHTRYFDNEEAAVFARIKKEVVLRVTNAGRISIRATVLENERRIKTLLIQKYSTVTGPHEHSAFTFYGDEIPALLDFIRSIEAAHLQGDKKLQFTNEQLRQVTFSLEQARAILNKNPELFRQLAQTEELTRDLIAVGYRRKQLNRFRAMMADPSIDEPTWQAFFEENTWIFGYGLSYQFLSSLDGKSLEQTVRGTDIEGGGKRVDALMKTRGRINSLCFVEIKKHTTPLISREYRTGAWAPHYELAGGVAQVQNTVHTALENLARAFRPRHEDGGRTGEVLYNIQPRSCLVIGNLADFYGEHGLDEDKHRSFELFRRNITSPEIITFDELLERAQFIVERAQDATEEIDDDIPF